MPYELSTLLVGHVHPKSQTPCDSDGRPAPLLRYGFQLDVLGPLSRPLGSIWYADQTEAESARDSIFAAVANGTWLPPDT